MSALVVACPKCGRELKLRDRSALGKKGKCPKCEHVFVLEEPVAVGATAESVGTARKRESAAPVPPPAPAPPAPVTPPVSAAAPPAEDAGVVVRPVGDTAVMFAGIDPLASPATARRRKKKSLLIPSILGGLAVLGVGGAVGYMLMNPPPEAAKKSQAAKTTPKETTAAETPVAAAATSKNAPEYAVPERGKPVTLQFIPAGTRIAVHLRPADLWKSESLGEEFRYCLGPLADYVAKQLKEQTHREPAQIEEALFCFIPDMRGTPPIQTTVVRFAEPLKKSEFLDEFQGQRDDSHGFPVYLSDNKAFVLSSDAQSLAIGPATLAAEMAMAAGNDRNPTSVGIEQLLPQTDRSRHLTVIFEPAAAKLDSELLVPANVKPLFDRFLDWFGDDVETVAWSLKLEQDRFYSQAVLRTATIVEPPQLARLIERKLGELPETLLAGVQKMQPKEAGKRSVIGRVPAMAQAFAMATRAEPGNRSVTLTTPLPERAGPNLALGTLLAWDESTRTDFTKAAGTTVAQAGPGANNNTKVIDRLKQKIDADFRRTPLQEAFAYVSEEIKTPIEIDGDALKLSGYTKNMPQEFKMEKVTAGTVLAEVLKKYDKMCLVIDEEKKSITILTFPVAEARGLKPLPLADFPK